MPEPTYADRLVPGLLDPTRLAPPGLGAATRYDVHRNNVTSTLVDALAAIYPAVERLVGRAFFRTMAVQHVRETPPDSPLLFEYGHGFPAFIEGYDYAADLPWLADVARIERAWLDAYHAADAAPLTLADLAAVDPGRLAEVVLVPHPAARVLRSPWPARSIFVMNRGPEAPETTETPETPDTRLDIDAAEDTLITRPAFDVTARALPPGGAVLLQALLQGQPLGAAVEAAASAHDDFDINLHLAGLLEAGVFTHFQLGDPAP